MFIIITNFILKNFKTFKEARLHISPFTVIVGPSGSGKTNLIEGLKYISYRSKGRSNEDIFSEIRGGLDYSYNDSGTSFSISAIDDQGIVLTESKYKSVTDNVDSNEPLSFVETFYSSLDSDCSLKLGVDKNIPPNEYTAQAIGSKHLYRDFFNKSLSNIMFYDMKVSATKFYTPISDNVIKNNASNLSSVLYSLFQNADTKKEIVSLVARITDSNITDMNFSVTEFDEVMLFIEQTHNNVKKKIPITLLSEGYIRAVGIFAVIYSLKKEALLVIDNFDKDLHPFLASNLTKLVSYLAKKKEIFILTTSHNTAVLNSLSREEKKGVALCYTNKDGYSELIKLTDIPNYLNILSVSELGTLVTNRKFTKQMLSPTEADYSLDWLVK